MTGQQRGITLIGMPGSGKTTVGRLLATRLGLEFLDSDELIEAHTGRSLQDIVDTEGTAWLRVIEAGILAGIDAHARVVATGGSAVYAGDAMRHLAEASTIVYLEVGLEELRRRVSNWSTRGLVRAPGQGVEELFAERTLLYLEHAELRLDCAGLEPGQVVERLVGMLLNRDGSATAQRAASPP